MRGRLTARAWDERGVACDGVEAKRQERLEHCGVVDRAGRDAESGRSEGRDQRARKEEVPDA